jgi:hypothetical protein
MDTDIFIGSQMPQMNTDGFYFFSVVSVYSVRTPYLWLTDATDEHRSFLFSFSVASV